MRLLICTLMLCVACTANDGDTRSNSLLTEVGRLENTKLDEASGLAGSNRQEDLYWAVNDDGPAVLHALNSAGNDLGRVSINGATNRDWEDIASFVLDDTPYLVIADIGDNEAKHSHLSLYFIEEPAVDAVAVELAWQLDFQYPDGPRDAEALAVDADGKQVYVLSKRTVPAELYRLPLLPLDEPIVTAGFSGAVSSLPQPSAADLRNAAGSGYGWQPTGMDFAPDGGSLVVLTYAGINYFSREPGTSWAAALQGRAMHLGLGRYRDAEAVAYTADSKAVIVTVEKKHAPVLRIELAL